MKSLKWINTIAFCLMILVNVLANTIPIGGYTTGEVSFLYPSLFTPTPLTFGIWGFIYLLMAFFVVFQLGILGNSSTARVVRDTVGCWFAISCALNICWMFSWHLGFIGLSVVFIILLLISLIVITGKLYVSPTSLMNFLMVKLGFDIYYGWIIAATIANISVFLVKLEWNRFGISEVIWTLIVLALGALIGAVVAICDGRYFASLAIIWSYVGIVIRHVSTAGYGGQYKSIIVVAGIGICIMFSACIIRVIFPKPKVGINSVYR